MRKDLDIGVLWSHEGVLEVNTFGALKVHQIIVECTIGIH